MLALAASMRHMNQEKITSIISDSIATKQALFDTCVDVIDDICQRCITCVNAGGKLLICGNGGSFSDSLHIVGELIGRYGYDRPAIPAIALGANGASMTAIGNDYGYEQVFSREADALANTGDAIIGLSTSGGSKNVIAAIEAAKAKGAIAIGLTGEKQNTATDAACEVVLHVPSGVTPRIQECHILVGHLIAQAVEEARFPK